MRTTCLNVIRLPVVIAIVCSLIAIVSSSASAAAAITVMPNHGTVGTEVTVQAGGFIAGGNLTVRFDGVRMTTTPPTPWTDENGEAIFTAVIPPAPSGTHYISVSDFVSSAGAFFEIEPQVQITSPLSKSGPVGTYIIVHGTGFTASVGGYVKIEDATLGNITLAVFGLTDLSGSFWEGNASIPSLSPGNHTVWALDLAGASTWTASYAHNDTFVVTSEAAPSISVIPGSGGAGISVTVQGCNFTANGYIPAGGITWDYLSWNEEAVAIDAMGQFQTVLVVPLAAEPGVYLVRVTDSDAQTAYSTFVVTSEAEPSISVIPETGGAGISVTVQGYDFTANGYIPVGGIMFGNSSWNSETVTIDAIGQFQTVLVVPPAADPGVNVVYAYDNEEKAAYATFEVYEQTVEISPDSGAKGTILILSGSYFTPNCVATISVTNEKYGTRTLEKLTTSSNGSISWTYRVKAAPFAIGLNTISVQDSNGKTASAIFTLLKK
jgi:hypothetical protein